MKINVLLVDDIIEMLLDDSAGTYLKDQLKEVCEKKDINLIPFSRSIEALDYIKKNKDAIHTVITDYRMPNMNGFDLCKEIEKVNSNIRVIIMSIMRLEDRYKKFCYKFYVKQTVVMDTFTEILTKEF